MLPIFICHECDLINKAETVPEGAQVSCTRCGAVLYKKSPASVERTLALCIAGLLVFFVANAFPFLGFQIGDRARETLLLTGVINLYLHGMWTLATIVFITVFLVPLITLGGLCYVLLPVYLGRRFVYMKQVLLLTQKLTLWSMTEVFMLGILVSLVKLTDMAVIIPGAALYAFMTLIFITACTACTFNPYEMWILVEQNNEN